MNKLYYLLSALTFFACFSATAQQNKSWADFERYHQQNEGLNTSKMPQAVFMGNSITDFWYNNDSTFFINHNYLDRGISGQTTSQMLVRFRRDVIDLHPKVVIILAGTNDIAQNTGYISLKDILGNLISMAELAMTHHIKVILCSLTPAFDYPWHKGMQPNIKIPKLNAMLQAYANKHHIAYIDYFSAMTDGNNGMRTELSKDGVHPTLAGYKIMEKISSEAILKLAHN